MKTKIKKFIYEYANYKIDILWNNNLMQEKIRNEKINKISRVINALECGLITIDECMRSISEI